MEYIIHVIDETSQYKKTKEGYKLEESMTEDEKKYGHAIRYDSSYHIDAEGHTEAVIEVANAIRIKDSEGNIVPLTKVLMETRDQKEKQFEEVKLHNVEIVDNTNSKLLRSVCRIPLKDQPQKEEETAEEYVELHEIYFYAIPLNKIIHLEKSEPEKSEEPQEEEPQEETEQDNEG